MHLQSMWRLMETNFSRQEAVLNQTGDWLGEKKKKKEIKKCEDSRVKSLMPDAFKASVFDGWWIKEKRKKCKGVNDLSVTRFQLKSLKTCRFHPTWCLQSLHQPGSALLRGNSCHKLTSSTCMSGKWICFTPQPLSLLFPSVNDF